MRKIFVVHSPDYIEGPSALESYYFTEGGIWSCKGAFAVGRESANALQQKLTDGWSDLDPEFAPAPKYRVRPASREDMMTLDEEIREDLMMEALNMEPFHRER